MLGKQSEDIRSVPLAHPYFNHILVYHDKVADASTNFRDISINVEPKFLTHDDSPRLG